MAFSDEWFIRKLSDLLDEDLRISTLSELKNHLKSLPNEEAARITSLLQLPLVFDCLNDTNLEQVDLACDVLSLCLSNLNLGESTNRYSNALERALIHPFPPVKIMVLKEIERSIVNEDALYALCQKLELIKNIVSCIGDDNLEVAKKASSIILIMGVSIPGINRITSNEIVITLEETMGLNGVVRLRIYELLVNVCKESDHSFAKLKPTGLISKMLDELENNDVLLKMNIIEILSQLSQSQHGFIFLDNDGVLRKIFSLIEEDELTTQLCQPGVLKFFGQLAHQRPSEMLSKYPEVFDKLFLNMENNDPIILGVTIDTIGYIGLTNQGKEAFASTNNKIEDVIKTISGYLGSLPTDIRIRALNCVESLLTVTEMNGQILSLTEKWYRLLGSNSDPIEIVLKYAKNPFSEIRLAGLGILNAIAKQRWGHEVIRNCPGLVEFLLDRNIETVKACKEVKFEIIKALSNGTVFDSSTLERLQAYVKEGPFYVQAITEVAIEGN